MNKTIINNLYKASNLLLITLPLLYGCGGSSGGGSSSMGSFIGPTASSGTEFALLSSVPEADSSGSALLASVPEADSSRIARIHNPEPATMLLLGGGMLAMRFARFRPRK